MTSPNTNPPPPGDDDIIPLGVLNDFLFCPRRAWLHRVEGVFTHTADTLEGTFAHERTDAPHEDRLPGVRTVRALPLFNRALGLSGKADVVEFHMTSPGQPERPCPVDYKHGPRQKWSNDDAQLCGQALCLEEMFATAVPTGAIFHIASKRRREVVFDQALRQKTLDAITAIRAMLASTAIPPAVLLPKCEGCSLHSMCMPEVAMESMDLSRVLDNLFRCDQ